MRQRVGVNGGFSGYQNNAGYGNIAANYQAFQNSQSSFQAFQNAHTDSKSTPYYYYPY